MRILVLADIAWEEDNLDKGVEEIKEMFPGVEVQYLKWPVSPKPVFNMENLKIEKNGPEAGIPVPGIEEAVADFDPEVIITYFSPVTKQVIDIARSLEIICVARGGYENVSLKAATDRNIFVFNVTGRTANSVAEYTVAMMLAESRNIGRSYHKLMTGEWWKPVKAPTEISGCTVGIVGFGNIGQKVAERLKGFDVNIIAYDPYLPDDVFSKYGAKKVALDELMSQADFVNLHATLRPETKNLISGDKIKLMKPTAYLINTARAGLMDYRALVNALKNRQIRGAAIDVYETEPIAADDPLVSLDNVTLTSHIAGRTVQAGRRTKSLFVETFREVIETRQSKNIVNFSLAEQGEIAQNMKSGK